VWKKRGISLGNWHQTGCVVTIQIHPRGEIANKRTRGNQGERNHQPCGRIGTKVTTNHKKETGYEKGKGVSYLVVYFAGRGEEEQINKKSEVVES